MTWCELQRGWQDYAGELNAHLMIMAEQFLMIKYTDSSILHNLT